MQNHTPTPFAWRLGSLAAALLLSACGGGGVSTLPATGAQPTVVAPTTTPTATPTPAPTQGPSVAQPLGLKPLVALGEVVINDGPGLRRVGDDRYASVGKLLLDSSGRLVADGKTLQVIQALTGPDAKLAVVTDPNDRSRYLVLLRMANISDPSQTAKYLCAAGTWSPAELSQFVGMDELYAAPCEGDVQFKDSSIDASLIINRLRVANRLNSAPAATVTAHLDTTSGSVDFESYDQAAHWFQEVNQAPLGTLEISTSMGGRIPMGSFTFRKAIDDAGEQAVAYYQLSNDRGTVELTSIYAEESENPVVSILARSDTPAEFILFIQANPLITVACRSANMTGDQASSLVIAVLRSVGLSSVYSAGPLDVCNDASYDPLTYRLRMKDTVLNQRGTVSSKVMGKLLNSATVSANVNTRPSF